MRKFQVKLIKFLVGTQKKAIAAGINETMPTTHKLSGKSRQRSTKCSNKINKLSQVSGFRFPCNHIEKSQKLFMQIYFEKQLQALNESKDICHPNVSGIQRNSTRLAPIMTENTAVLFGGCD